LDLDLRTSVNFCSTRASLVVSPTSSASTDGHLVLIRYHCIGAWWPRITLFGASDVTTSVRQGVCLPLRLLVAMHHPLPFLHLGFRWFMAVPCDSCWREAFQWWHMVFTRQWLPVPSFNQICCVVLSAFCFNYLCFCFLYFWAFRCIFLLCVLYNSVWII